MVTEGGHSPSNSADPFEALGDPHRRDILRLLSEGDKPVSQIAAALPISRPAVSRHLRLLKQAGLVAEHPQGTRRIYRVDPDGLAGVRDQLERFWTKALAAYKATVEQASEERR